MIPLQGGSHARRPPTQFLDNSDEAFQNKAPSKKKKVFLSNILDFLDQYFGEIPNCHFMIPLLASNTR